MRCQDISHTETILRLGFRFTEKEGEATIRENKSVVNYEWVFMTIL